MSNELTIEEILMLGNKTMANLILSQHAEINARKDQLDKVEDLLLQAEREEFEFPDTILEALTELKGKEDENTKSKD